MKNDDNNTAPNLLPAPFSVGTGSHPHLDGAHWLANGRQMVRHETTALIAPTIPPDSQTDGSEVIHADRDNPVIEDISRRWLIAARPMP